MSMTETALKPRPRGRFRPGQSGNPLGSRVRIKRSIAATLRRCGPMAPLDFLLVTINSADAKIADKLEAARIAAPFMHRPLPAESEIQCPTLTEYTIGRADAVRKGVIVG